MSKVLLKNTRTGEVFEAEVEPGDVWYYYSDAFFPPVVWADRDELPPVEADEPAPDER